MNLKKLLIGIAGVILLLPSCDSYLDQVPDEDILSVPAIFETRDGAERWMKDVYAGVPTLYGGEFQDPGLLGGDEFVGGQYSRTSTYLSMFYIADGQQSAVAPYGDIWRFNGIYNNIRFCNTFLENLNDVYNLRPGELKVWTAEAKAVKAFYYFEMVKRYGPIALIPNNIDVWEPLEKMKIKRSHVDTCFNEIVSLLDEAIPDLLVMAEKDPERFEYFSKEGAIALKAKVLLFQASPLFNGNSFYRDFRNSEGELLFDPEYKEEKWRIAAEAADEAVRICEENGYQLISGSADRLSPLLNTMRDIELSIWAPNYQSTEALVMIPSGNRLFQHTLPSVGTNTGNRFYDASVYGDVGTSVQMVERFYTKNGLPLSEDNTWDYERRYTMGRERNNFYNNVVNLDNDVLVLHLNREPRFYANIAGQGTYWQRGAGTYYNLLMETYRGEAVGIKQNQIESNAPQNLTGYWVKKGSRTEVPINGYSSQLNSSIGYSRPKVALRLAELYLIQAEAWNEYEGPNGAHKDEIFSALDKIRERAGIPSVEDAWTQYAKNPDKITTKEGMREIIRQERTIELSFEGQRFWDLRRWKTAHLNLNSKPTGWNVLGRDAREYFNNFEGPKVVWDKAEFLSPRDYLFPIKSEEVMISGNVQNPEW
ncbi:RagB/SusD family nutrient uptake outer membrane protein [Plebeiibacterium sediminum]|uniref:RagB/SusD family nutrient uptake outer membrane protein n=1 Tax=Plebeiibacterium sediminum TaxID=2992112 RepID=A0AAE3M473_9BACT|nr:RagB/SusD family nutrient uptake outer membrane protein [Plebeiobacterium sediminum]MCW3786814.1 RagB/SusD family nutrient uptake outer membrane protein [Plebeiobacterium sediminum]